MYWEKKVGRLEWLFEFEVVACVNRESSHGNEWDDVINFNTCIDSKFE